MAMVKAVLGAFQIPYNIALDIQTIRPPLVEAACKMVNQVKTQLMHSGSFGILAILLNSAFPLMQFNSIEVLGYYPRP